MSFTGAFAKVVALVGAGAVLWRRRLLGQAYDPAMGGAPVIPEARDQGSIPTLKMPTAMGWDNGRTPVPAEGLAVNAFATGLDHPRWMLVLPNGDVTVSEAMFEPPQSITSLFEFAITSTMTRAGAIGKNPNRITLLRDADGDGTAEIRQPFLENLRQPFGMALLDDTFYVGNTDGLVAFPYEHGAGSITAPGKQLNSFKPGGHWTRSLLPSADGKKLYIGVGSDTNIAERGMDIEEGRAAIHVFDLQSGETRIFASGLRNPVGLAFAPDTGDLWTVVNERDGLGDETPPDYLTSVHDGGFYGWPYCYWGQTVDTRVPQNPEMVARAIQPDFALGGHTASLGLCWMPEGTLPGFGDGMVIGQHGSWNRSTLSGYKVIFVPFENGRPAGEPRNILTGFLSPDERHSWGRPVGVTIGAGGESLLVADDVGNAIWRVTGA
jgi:hypothetical protein